MAVLQAVEAELEETSTHRQQVHCRPINTQRNVLESKSHSYLLWFESETASTGSYI